MRELILTNGIVDMDLTNKEHFLNRPQGFGFAFSTQYFRTGNTQTAVERIYELPSITADMIFAGKKPHEEFAQFLNFIDTDALWVYYAAADDGYLIPVNIEQMSKGEREMNGTLVCPIVIRALAPWQKVGYQTSVTVQQTIQGSKTYPYTYGYSYFQSVGGVGYIECAGHFDAGIIAYITGACDDPVLKGEVDGVEVFNMSLAGSIADGETLTYDNIDGEESVMLDGVNVIAATDITKKLFGKLPKGKTVTVTLTATNGTPEAQIFLREYYKAV